MSGILKNYKFNLKTKKKVINYNRDKKEIKNTQYI